MSSFQLYVEDTLTTPISSQDLLEYTDLSDNPTDKVYYFGSVITANQLTNADDPGVDYIIITPTDILPEWEASTTYTLGDRVQQVGGGSFVFEVTTAGTSNSSEPSWGGMGGLGSTITDNTVVWTKKAAHHAITEVTLALSSGDLDTNTPGDPLYVAQVIDGGTSNAIPIYMRVINAVTNVSNSTSVPEIALKLNNVIEITP